jgi:hypothetical protein
MITHSHDSTFGLVIFLILLTVLASWYSRQLRYFLRLHRAKRWPVVAATLQKGAIGRVPVGKGASVPAAFLGYAYIVQGVRCAGFCALYGDDAKVRRLHDDLPGEEIQVRCDPSDPNVSFLKDYDDPRFDGLRATQNPDWLSRCPEFNLQDAVR